MKKSKKIIFGALSTASTVLVATPLITSCSNSSDIKQVDRGDGKNFANFRFTGQTEDTPISFKDVLARAATTKDGFSAFKQQIAKELIYNWYQGIKNSSKAPQSFKDNWNTWTDAANKAYDDKVQSYKDSHSKTWEYYFQNEVLDPVGGTKEAFIRQQMYDKVYDAFKNLVFTNNYLAYSTTEDIKTGEGKDSRVNSPISSFTATTFSTPTEWANIDFYAKANTSYTPDSQDLDDVYALIQKEAFEEYTLAKHPQALLMALWKYAAPTEGMYEIYSNKIPKTDEEKKSVNAELGDETTKTLKAKYETPAFPVWSAGGAYTANAKFTELVRDFWINPFEENIDINGEFHYANKGSIYQDDGSTMGFVLNMNEMYSKLDTWFSPAVTELYQQAINIVNGDATTDLFLDYPVDKLLSYGNDGDVDILSNFFFRSNDDRIFGGSGVAINGLKTRLKALDDAGAVLDLNKVFLKDGNGAGDLGGSGSADFHSSIFLNSASAVGDYYGYNNTQGGVQWAVNALWLTDADGNRLPYILFRDTNGVHLCGLYGAWSYQSNALKKGFIADDSGTYNVTVFGEAWSQERQNIQLKALNLYMKTRKESLFDISSEVKSYFTSNVDDIVINMAMNDVRRGNDAGESEQHKGDIIFNIDTVLGGVQRTDLQAILDGSATFFLLQNTLTTYQEANKKLYGLVSTHISNALLSRSTEAILAKKTENNYKNALASPLQYAGVYSNSTYDTDLYTGYLSFPIALYSNWVNVQKDGNVFKVVNAKEDVFSASVGKTTVDATTAYSNGLETLIPKYDAIITTLGIENASLPSSPYASWSEHLNPAYAYNADKATSAIANGLYMAINKYLSSTELTNGIKIDAGIEYAKGTTAKPGIIDGQDETTGLAKFKTKYAQLEQAAASFVYSNKLFTNDTPLSFYTNSSATMDEDTYFTLIKRLGTQSTTAARKINRNNDDLVTYWTFIDTLQYLVKDDYANLMKYLQTSVMSYGVEADLVWVAQDDRNANPSFMNDTTLTNIYGWKQNYMGKYDGTYLHNMGSTGPSSYIANSAYYQSAPLKYGASSSMMGMGFAGLATSSSSPSSITTTLQNALFTDTYRSKTDSGKTKHYGGWFKYGSMEKLETYINKLSSVADIQKLATNLGAANEDPLFTSHVLDVVKRTTFQDGDPEITAANTPFKVGQALSAEVLKNRLLGVKNAKYGDATVNYVTAEWGLNWYCYVDPSANPKVLKDEIKELFTRFGGADLSTGVSNGIAQELYDVNSGSHAMPSTSDASTASQYARMMVIQLNYDDFQPATISGTEYTALENLCYALSGTLAKKDAANFDTTLLNYIAVQYAQVSSLQNQATNDIVKTILGTDNKVTVYDRRLNDKLGPTWVKDYKSTN